MKINWTKVSCVLMVVAWIAFSGYLGYLWGSRMDRAQAERVQLIADIQDYLCRSKGQEWTSGSSDVGH